MTQISNTAISEEQVLLAFSAEPNQDRAIFEAYLARYPQYTEALVELAAELMLAPHREVSPCSTDDVAVDKAWASFQSALPLEIKNLTTADSLLANLSPGAFRNVAQLMDVSPFFLSRIRDRAVDFATIPAKFLEALASALGASMKAITADLSQGAVIAVSQKFKADQKPASAAKISFLEALNQSGLTEQQRAKLEALME